MFDLVFQNLKLAAGLPPKLVRDDPKTATYFAVEFPPQSFGEEAYLDATGQSDTGSGPDFPESSASAPPKNSTTATPAEPLRPMPASRVRMSGKSRIAFTMPAALKELGFDLASVMKSVFTPKPGSLPRLRYGRSYRVRARMADLATNSLAPNEADRFFETPSGPQNLRYSGALPGPVLHMTSAKPCFLARA